MDVFYSNTSLKRLSKLEKEVGSNIVLAIEKLPYKGYIQKMRGKSLQNLYRLRVGKYRVLYIRETNAIRILDIDTRGDIYK
ncbi:MAG: type II toxin-antitoxin system RelE/ParE family toxin [Acidobacteria bacterium]|nr:type II toxin-antitoxin system RelE/ParE family toxin [Acidobacteriota bacterium]